MRDFKRMQNDPPEGVNGAPCDNDIMKWHAVIFGCVGPPPAHALPRRCSSIAPPAHRLHPLDGQTHPLCPLHTGPRTPRGRTARSS